MTDSIWMQLLPEEQRAWLQAPGLGIPTVANAACTGTSLIELITAWFAADQGRRIVVLTSADQTLGELAPWWGVVAPNVDGIDRSTDWQALASHSRDTWAKLAVRPGLEFGWKVTGAWACHADAVPSPRERMLLALDQGLSLHKVDADQFRLAEPHFIPPEHGGLQSPSDAILQPAAAVATFVQALKERKQLVTLDTDLTLEQSASWQELSVVSPAEEAGAEFYLLAGLTEELTYGLRHPLRADWRWQPLPRNQLLAVGVQNHQPPAAPVPNLDGFLPVQWQAWQSLKMPSAEPVDPVVSYDPATQRLTVQVDPRDVTLLAAGLGQLLEQWQRTGECPALLHPFSTTA